jgi:hypothetical protein
LQVQPIQEIVGWWSYGACNICQHLHFERDNYIKKLFIIALTKLLHMVIV